MVTVQQFKSWLCTLALSFLLLCSLFSFGNNFGNNLAIAAPAEITIEWLQFEVPEAEQALFIEKEYEIWEPLARRSPDYLGKEMWQDANHPDLLTMVNRWSSTDHRGDITTEMVQQAEKDFSEAVGKNYPLIETKTFRRCS